MDAGQAVLRFLRNVGPGADAEFYLGAFRSRPAESFAVIAVDETAMQNGADSVAVDLRFLRALDLTPVVLLGLHEPASAAAHAQRLADLLAASNVATRVLPGGNPGETAAAARAGAIPLVVLPQAEATARLRDLATLLTAHGTHKLIFVRPQGGLRVGAERASVVNLAMRPETMPGYADFDAREREILEASRSLIFELVPHRLLVALTSPLDLLRELFTVKGAGTLIKRGAQIVCHEGYAGVDRERLEELFLSSFGRRPHEAFFSRPLSHAYVEAEYRGAALLAEGPFGAYLTKFAVTREAQGEGIGQDLWGAIEAEHARLLWRARTDNPIRPWYERQCDGRLDVGRWTVYFKGLDVSAIPEAVAFALAQSDDFTAG